MKIVKARQLLGKIIQPHGDLLNNRPVIKYQFGDGMVMLSGVFSYDDVEAVLTYMRSTRLKNTKEWNHLVENVNEGKEQEEPYDTQPTNTNMNRNEPQ
jgi:hypothetical protein